MRVFALRREVGLVGNFSVVFALNAQRAGTKRTRFGRLGSNRGADFIRTHVRLPIGLVEMPVDRPLFSPDAQWVLWCAAGEPTSPQFVCNDVQTGNLLWRRIWPVIPAEARFTPDSRHLVVRLPDAAEAEVLDAATGATERTIAMPGLAGQNALLRCDGRTLAAAVTEPEPEPFWLLAKVRAWLPDRPEPAPRMVVRFFDFATGEPIGEVMCEDTGEWWLTADRQGLIAVYDETDERGVAQTVIQCWDIPPHRPLRWIVGVPLALGVVFVSLRFGWRRWRRLRRPTAPAQASPSCASGA